MERKGIKIFARVLPYLLLFVFSFCLCLLFVPIFDDVYFYQINDGTIKTAWENAVRYGNGRYIGNFICFFIVRYHLLTAFIKAISLPLLVFFIKRSQGLKGKTFTWLVIFLLVFIPPKMIGEVFNWTAAYVNYLIPVLMILICLYFVKILSEHKKNIKPIISVIMIAVILILGFCIQLFSENTSAFCVFMTLVISVYFAVKKEKAGFAASFIWFLSSAAGFALVMLGTDLIKPDDGFIMNITYKSSIFSNLISAETVKTVLRNLVIFENSIGSNVFLFSALSFVMIIVTSKAVSENKKTEAARKTIRALLFVYPFFSAFSLFLRFQPVTSSLFLTALNVINLMMLLLYAVAVVAGIALFVFDRKEKGNLIFWCIMAVASAGILVIVNPIATRCFYLTDILLSIVVIKLANLYKEEIKNQIALLNGEKILLRAGKLALAAVFIVLAVVYSDVRFVDNIREEYVAQEIEKGADTVIAPDLPHETFLVEEGADCGVYASTHYKEKSGDVTYKSIDTDDWFESHYYDINSDSLENKLHRVYNTY